MTYEESLDIAKSQVETAEGKVVLVAIERVIKRMCPEDDDRLKMFIAGGLTLVYHEGIVMTKPVPLGWITRFTDCIQEFVKELSKENVLLN